MHRSRDRRTEYMGLPITIRWTELDRGDAWGPEGHRFAGSYLIAAKGGKFGAWHQVEEVFTAYDAAAARALAAAKRSIDDFWDS
jgi:hypothetical protein